MQTTVQGRVVGYKESGQGAPLVLIHGYPLRCSMWKAQLEAFSSMAHVIAPDLRGFGESENVPGTGDINFYADDIRELLDSMGVHEPAVIAGHSMGGYVAMAYLRRYPSHVRALILANTKATPDTTEGKAGRDRNIAIAKDKGAEAIAEGMLPKLFSPKTYTSNPELVEHAKEMMLKATVPGIIAALEAMRDRPDSTGTLLEYGSPTLVVAGADDQLMPMAEQETMKEASHDGTLVVVPDAGHLTMMEQPAAFNKAIMDFWEELA